ncbi:MAG: hypothetical protein RLZZ505_542 [Verrucomicrobiota bacterium]
MISSSDLRGFGELSGSRKALIEAALEALGEVSGMPYKYGGNGAVDGGFDCSGAVYHVLRKAGLKPPRTSADQFLWVREKSKLHPVPLAARDITHEAFTALQPGDLLFWTGTYEPDDARVVKITHVATFLGYEKIDGRPVMINATDGRSYRGVKVNGYGVCDFQVPKEGSKSRLVGYGAPPGVNAP